MFGDAPWWVPAMIGLISLVAGAFAFYLYEPD